MNYKFNSEFFMTYDYLRYPLDEQLLSATFEDKHSTQEYIALELDESSAISGEMDIPGFSVPFSIFFLCNC